MRRRHTTPKGLAVPALALFAALCLAGCGGGDSAKSASQAFFQAGTEPQVIDAALIAKPVTCPRIEQELGAQAIRRTKGDGPTAPLSWQASITNTARECKKADDGTLRIRVGVSGRIVEGTVGAPSQVVLPLHISVREGTETIYDKVHKITVNRSGPSQDWAFVDENVVAQNAPAAQIFVGFQE